MPVIKAAHVSKKFLLRHNRATSLKERLLGVAHRRLRETREEFWALRDVSLAIERGEAVALIGRNGSGKSTFLKLTAGTYLPTEGRMLLSPGTKVGSMIELGIGFHPELSGQENVYLNASINGLGRAEIDAIYDRIVEYAGLAHFMDTPLKNYSSGMHMRLGFAVAAHLRPDVLLLDEILAVGDEDFQRKCMRTIETFRANGVTILFVSHAPNAVRTICQRACLLDHGRLLFDGSVDDGLTQYQRLLLDAQQPAPAEGGATEPATPVVPSVTRLSDSDLDVAWHRQAIGGQWEEVGRLQFEFLRSRGLRPSHHVLDVGCGSLRLGVHAIPHLEGGHYWGLDKSRELVQAGVDIELARLGLEAAPAQFVISETFDLTSIPVAIDRAIAYGLFPLLTLNSVARCIASVVRVLAPGGVFYASYFENPVPGRFDPIVHPGGTTTFPDCAEYHYDFETLARICEVVGARADRLGPWGDPRGQMMLAVGRAGRVGQG